MEKNQKQLLELVLKLTGAKSAILVLGDETMPCEQAQKGEECHGNHQFLTYHIGMQPKHVGPVLHHMAHEEMEKGNDQIDVALAKLFGNEEGNERT